MQQNDKAQLEFETGQTFFTMRTLTNSGDATTYTSEASLFSEADGVAPDIRPNGVITGGAVTIAVSEADNAVDVSALSCFLAGVETSVSAATDKTITRPATAVSKVNSITVNSSGIITVIAGTDGTDTTFSENRGAAGAPPYIPTGSIEIAQVRVTSNTAAPILSSQIFAIAGVHLERYDVPAIDKIDNSTGKVIFASALPKIHTGGVPKAVYGSYAEPIFMVQRYANDFVPAEKTSSTSSAQVYDDVVATESKSLSQSAFTAILNDGVTDSILSKEGQTLWFRFKPNKLKTANILTQGKVSFSRTFSASDHPKVSIKISATSASINKAS